jgi:16S rRNA (guanine527-N7)-methyltransferase
MNDYLNAELYLEQGLKQFDLESFCKPVLAYLTLLNKWNLAYNLTAVRDLESMINKHILDSLAISPWLKGRKIIDVGTGAGLPGIPLAITNPQMQLTLLDSNGKKTRFLAEVKRQLDLENIEIVQFRIENYRPAQGFDTVVSRAFSSLDQMIHWTQHLIAPNGIWLAMKGRYPTEELNLIHKPYRVEPYRVEGIEGERCCVLIDNTTKE